MGNQALIRDIDQGVELLVREIPDSLFKMIATGNRLLYTLLGSGRN